MFGKLASTSFGPHFADNIHKILDIEPLQTISEETTVPMVKNVSQATGGEDTPRSTSMQD